MNLSTFIEWACDRHDVYCNQKYDGKLPYSFHLQAVRNQALYYWDLERTSAALSMPNAYHYVAIGHDLIEDARCSYNDIVTRTSVEVADAIYTLTKFKGKTRKDRLSSKYWEEVSYNDIAKFIKACDIMANVLYGILNRSSILDKYKEEWPKIKGYLGNGRIVTDLNDLLTERKQL